MSFVICIEEDFDPNASAVAFEEQVRREMKNDGLEDKEIIDKETFVKFFMKVTSNKKENEIKGQEKYFIQLAEKIADNAGDPIKTKDIPTLLNLNEMIVLYSQIIEDAKATFEEKEEQTKEEFAKSFENTNTPLEDL